MLPHEKPHLSGLSEEELQVKVAEAMGEFAETENLDEFYGETVKDFHENKIVNGRIRQMLGGGDALVDIGYKSEAFLPSMEVDHHDEVKEGDEVEVLIERVDEEVGVIVLSKRKADRIRGWEQVIERHSVGDVVTGRAVRKIKGGLLVDIGVPVFLPASQVDIRRTGDVGEWIGRDMRCKIIKIDEDRRNIVLSRRKLLEEERDKMKKKLLQEIERGQVRRGVVKNITDFGAFIDLGGIDGLLHITDISWGRVGHPSEAVSIDQVLEVKVLDFDLERERISLGMKQLTPNPWSTVADKYPIHSRVRGEVVNIVPYGAFVKLEDGIEGLVHVSEMSWTRQISHPSEVVAIGDEVDVVVLDINQAKQEISLGMKQAMENPWEQVEARYPAGTRIKGTVRNLTSYGAFIELEEGIDGLLHVNDMSWTKKISHPSQVLKKGDEVECLVLEVDPERKRIALGLKQLEEDPWDSRIATQYTTGMRVTGTVTKLTSFGAFIEIAEDLEGLLHISEMSDDKIEKPEQMLNVGDQVEVKIINIDREERKIGLSIKALSEPDEPDTGALAAAAKTDAAPQTLGGKLEAAFAERAARERKAEQETAPEEGESITPTTPSPEEPETAAKMPEEEAAEGEPAVEGASAEAREALQEMTDNTKPDATPLTGEDQTPESEAVAEGAEQIADTGEAPAEQRAEAAAEQEAAEEEKKAEEEEE